MKSLHATHAANSHPATGNTQQAISAAQKYSVGIVARRMISAAAVGMTMISVTSGSATGRNTGHKLSMVEFNG